MYDIDFIYSSIYYYFYNGAIKIIHTQIILKNSLYYTPENPPGPLVSLLRGTSMTLTILRLREPWIKFSSSTVSHTITLKVDK